jgi:hypothetical protein
LKTRAVLPDVRDEPSGGPWAAHTLLASVVLLCGTMLATRGRRLLRRQLLAVPIGAFLPPWSSTGPGPTPTRSGGPTSLLGFDLGSGRLPSIERGPFNIMLELAGLAILVWAYQRFRLDEPARRSAFLRSGHLGRDLLT